MHKAVNQTPTGFDTDHIDRNRLNNQRSNLRTVTHQQNMFNAKLHAKSTSGYKGVFWVERYKGWRAYLVVDNRQVHIGYFRDKEEAIQARINAEKNYHIINAG